MKLAASLMFAVVVWQGEAPATTDLRYFQFERALQPIPGGLQSAASACAVLDAAVYAHSPTLADLRVFAGTQELPYALSTSQTAPTGDAATVLNAGMRGEKLAFDLQMPARPYTDVTLALAGQNFVATATVTGLRTPDDTHGTALGSFTLFDLSGTGLGRATTLKLVESTFPYLHVELAVVGAGGRDFPLAQSMITGAEVPPSRQAQTLYTTVAETSTITQVGRHSVATFHLPAHVPVERVAFTVAPGDRTNFSRGVAVLAHASGAPAQDAETRESISGTISRVHLVQGGRELSEEELTVPATIGANMEQPAEVQVWVENGDDRPVALAAVRLQMRQRLVCFGAAPGSAQPALYYGDAKLSPPVYDYARLYDPAQAAVAYQLGPEQANPYYSPRPTIDSRTFTDRHPEVVWIALLAVVAALGMVAFRSAKKV